MMFRGKGARTPRLLAYLQKRERTSPGRRGVRDCSTCPSLFHRHAVVYTDTADFTLRTARDGILHFLMVFNRLVVQAEPMLRRPNRQAQRRPPQPCKTPSRSCRIY